MATARFYANQLSARVGKVAFAFGVDVSGIDKQTRVMFRTIMIVLGVLVKIMVDKGVVTDAELGAAFDTVAGDTYPDEPVNPPVTPVVMP